MSLHISDERKSSLPRSVGRQNRGRRRFRPVLELLEDRHLLAFAVSASHFWENAGLRLVADFTQPVNVSTLQAGDLVVDGSQAATSFSVVDADTVEFLLPTLAAGAHSVAIGGGTILDTLAVGVDPFARAFTLASARQFTVKHNPRLQPGNAPLTGYAGSELDRVDILWQTIPGGAGTQDSFVVEYRPAGSTAAWQTATLNAPVNASNVENGAQIENRVIRSASITGLNWNADYTYRVRHLQADVIVAEYTSDFHTRLAAGDETPFTFAAYGDSASGTAAGFRSVQARINQNSPAFSVLLGDNVYDAGSHQQSDSRFDASVNPEAAEWMAGQIDYLGLGNHDVGTGSGFPSEQNYSVPIPVAGVTAPAAPPATERAEHSFSWDYGDVHFVTFDTNSLSDVARLDGLLKWVVADLNASTARWKIVYGHHPLAGVPDKPENPGDNYYQQVVNRLKAAGVDLFMTGHSHTYSWTYPLTGQINGTATYVNHGVDDAFHAGEGLTQLVSGMGGVESRPGDYSQFPFVAEGFTSQTAIPARFGYSQISVTQNKLTVDYIAEDNGAVIDSFNITKDDTLQAASFQQGANGYTGTVDTYLHQNTPGTSFATSASLKVDNDDPAASGLDAQALLRFDNLFGNGAGQIPTNAILRSATLQLEVTNSTVNNMNLHRMLGTWSATDTWNSLGSGIQTGVETLAAPDTSSGQAQVGQLAFNVLASLQAWQISPASNFGWAILPTGSDGIDFHSSEGATKPKLTVTWVLPSAVNDPPVATNDSATTNGNTAVIVSVLANDTDPNGNPLGISSATTPVHGTVVINAGSTITYTPAAGYHGSDSFTYNISDGAGGTASATVNVIVGQTLVFQQGLNGYAGTVDTYLEQNLPGTNFGTATSLNIDSDEPGGTGLDVQTLLRFDNLFGSGVGQIPVNSSLVSASLQVQVTNPGNSMNLHRMLANWSAADTWTSRTNGVQNDGTEATVTADVATGSAATGALSINVLTSVQAWLSAPATNLGWAFLPTGNDGVDFDSVEGTTRPKLTVFFIPSNNAPSFTAGANQTVLSNAGPQTLTGWATAISAGPPNEAGQSLSFNVTGNTNTAIFATQPAIAADGTLTFTPAAGAFGTAVITVNLQDNGGTANGGVDTSLPQTFTIAVDSPTPIVTALTSSPAGPRIRFNRSLNTGVLNLVDSNNALGAVDFTLTGAVTGNVRGSLVLDSDGRGFTFIKSGGPLAADTYTVTLRSAANGFSTTSGELLDGNGDGITGDNFTQTFVVAAPPANAVTVSVGDFVRGYGQAVNLPANTTAGIPITLSSGVNVAAASVVLTYDPALLTITGGSSPIVGATTIIDTSVPGQVTINVTSAGQFSATAGVVTLANLMANVPTTATYAAKNRLDLTVISLTDTVAAAIPSIADDGLHVSSYRGDLNGERTIGPGDGTLALRLQSGVLSTTGFTAFQQVDPYLISDMNDDGTATPGDITGLLRFQSGAAGGFNRIPPLPTGLAPPTTFAADPQIFIPTTGLTAKVGEVLTVPIRIKVTESQGIDLAGLSIALAYDANQFTIANVRLGSALTNQGFLASFNTSVPGMMQLIAVSDLGPAFSMGDIGDLFLFDLTVQPTAATGDFALNLLATTNATDNNTDNLLLLPAIQDGWDVNDGVVQVSSAISLRSDINDDGTVDINDVVAAIFYFNHSAGVDLSQATAEVKRANVVPDAQLDILDLLTVIYDYNVSRLNGEGESSSANDPPSRADASLADEETEDIFAVLAADLVQRKRK